MICPTLFRLDIVNTATLINLVFFSLLEEKVKAYRYPFTLWCKKLTCLLPIYRNDDDYSYHCDACKAVLRRLSGTLNLAGLRYHVFGRSWYWLLSGPILYKLESYIPNDSDVYRGNQYGLFVCLIITYAADFHCHNKNHIYNYIST